MGPLGLPGLDGEPRQDWLAPARPLGRDFLRLSGAFAAAKAAAQLADAKAQLSSRLKHQSIRSAHVRLLMLVCCLIWLVGWLIGCFCELVLFFLRLVDCCISLCEQTGQKCF